MKTLIKAATTARTRSTAPYSHFEVGAAIRGSSGTIYTGSNVEVSSYGLTICAERLAICIALHEGEREITDIAVVADTSSAPGPCGACRQLMYDFAPQARVIMSNLHGDTPAVAVGDLLPWGFGPDDLAAFRARSAQEDAENRLPESPPE